MPDSDLRRGVIPPGPYAGGGRSPVAWVWLCPVCGGYAPLTDPDYSGALSGSCQGCDCWSREVHKFPAVINSAEGCACPCCHERVTGDLAADIRENVSDR